ncbi:hypothetical protein CRYUN_Cryun04dG0181300 [Craigia yunnanensis]
MTPYIKIIVQLQIFKAESLRKTETELPLLHFLLKPFKTHLCLAYPGSLLHQGLVFCQKRELGLMEKYRWHRLYWTQPLQFWKARSETNLYLYLWFDSLRVTKTEEAIEATSWTEGGLIMAAWHKVYKHLQGVQFHPESIITSKGKTIVRNFIKLIERKKAAESQN